MEPEITDGRTDVRTLFRRAQLGMIVPRAIAHTIDVAILIGAFMLLQSVTALGHERSDSLFALGCASALGYFIVCEWRWGRTIGKRVLGIVVVKVSGESIGIGQAVVRNLFRIVEASLGPICLVGAAFVVLTKDSQRLGDLFAETYVVPASLLAGLKR